MVFAEELNRALAEKRITRPEADTVLDAVGISFAKDARMLKQTGIAKAQHYTPIIVKSVDDHTKPTSLDIKRAIANFTIAFERLHPGQHFHGTLGPENPNARLPQKKVPANSKQRTDTRA